LVEFVALELLTRGEELFRGLEVVADQGDVEAGRVRDVD
jgi:hypothetical protein